MADVPDRDLCAGRASAGRRSRLAGFVAGERPGLLATSLLLLVVTGAAWLLLVREPMQQALRLILGNPSFDLRRVTGAFFGLLLLMWPLDTLLLYLLGRAWGLTAPWGRLFLGIGKATAVQAGSIVAWALLATVPATLGSPRLAAASFPLWFLSVGSTRWATYPPAIKGAYGARARPKLWTLLAVVFEVLLVLLAGWAVVTLSGAISGTLLWLLHSPLAGLPRGWPRRLVGGLAGTLIAATASALVSALLCARMAALAARLVPAAAVAAGVAIQLVVWLPWLPVQLHGPSRGPASTWRELCGLTMILPWFYGWWFALYCVRAGSPLLDPVLVGMAAGALAGLFGAGCAGDLSLSTDPRE